MPYPYYGNPYYQPPMPDNLAQLRQNQMMGMPQMQAQPTQQPAQQSSNGVIWVQGEEGAKAYIVAPGSSVMLLDSEGSCFYIKSTDQSGMPLPLRIFDFTVRTSSKQKAAPQTLPQDYITREEFDRLAATVAAMKDANQKTEVPQNE
mgnify:CR=1 FL=1